MSEKYRRHFLKAKEAKSVLERASEKLKVDLEQIFKIKASVELVKTEFADILLVNGKPVLVEAGENVFPTLIFDEFLSVAPRVVVDMGAVPHVCSGANVMAPGIVRFDGEFGKGDFVLVVDEKYDKPIAVGEILYDVETVKKVSQGVIVRNVHFVGDRIWNFIKKLVASVSES
jgi:PUA-domain protein